MVTAAVPFLGTGLGDTGLRFVAEAGFGTVFGVPDGVAGLEADSLPDA